MEVEFPPKIDVPKPKVPQAAYYEAHLICEIQVKQTGPISYLQMRIESVWVKLKTDIKVTI